MTVGSLFSGIGGMDLGLERAGFEVRWQVEIDPACIRGLERWWPGVKRYGDIRTVKPEELGAVDLLCG
ncbi:MAG: DNA cytosine methyltransferase, partial [Firmicutes bacterium]|nr:DNA cytosine methyltransferase [Bacillota bacterium]